MPMLHRNMHKAAFNLDRFPLQNGRVRPDAVGIGRSNLLGRPKTTPNYPCYALERYWGRARGVFRELRLVFTPISAVVAESNRQ